MFKCKECGKIFHTSPDYCDCGNNNFSEIPDDSSVKNPAADKKGRLISIFIFILCIIFSLLIWLFD